MKDGTVIHRIGDDGCYMTKKRIIAHQSLNVVLVWGVVVLLATIVFASVAHLQGQTLSQFELIATGGNQYRGFYTADLLRCEAAFCFLGGLMMVGIHLHGFVWLYEKNRGGIAIALAVILTAASVCWFAFLVLIFLVSGVLAQKEKKESNIGV